MREKKTLLTNTAFDMLLCPGVFAIFHQELNTIANIPKHALVFKAHWQQMIVFADLPIIGIFFCPIEFRNENESESDIKNIDTDCERDFHAKTLKIDSQLRKHHLSESCKGKENATVKYHQSFTNEAVRPVDNERLQKHSSYFHKTYFQFLYRLSDGPI